MQYEVENLELDSLTRCYHGLYSELFIQNCTYENIVCVDNHNNKLVVPPMTNNIIGREQVIVWKRKTTNPTIQNNAQVSASGIRIIIPKSKLNKDCGIYISEIDLLICTEAVAVTAAHPLASTTYADAAAKATEEFLATIDKAPTIKLTANDPEGRYNKLYTVFGTSVIEINVTKMYGECQLTIHCFNDGQSDVYEVPLDEFFNSAENILDLEELPINFISTNKIKAKQYATDAKRMSQTEVDKIIKNANAKAAKEVAEIKQKFETEIDLAKLENKRLNESLKSVNAEKDDLDTKYRELKAVVNASNEVKDRDLKDKELSVKERVSDNDVKTSDAKRESAEKEATFKLYHLFIAAGIPIVAQLTMFGIKQYIAANTAKQSVKGFITFM